MSQIHFDCLSTARLKRFKDLHSKDLRSLCLAGTLIGTLSASALPADAQSTIASLFGATVGNVTTPIYDAYQVTNSTTQVSQFSYYSPNYGTTYSNGGESTASFAGFTPHYVQQFEYYAYDSNTDAYDIPVYGTVQDGGTYFSNISNSQPTAVTGSSATGPDLSSYGVTVFTGGGSQLAGQSFESAFLGGTSYTENEVKNEIAAQFMDTNVTDQAAYNTFLGTLTSSYSSPVGATATAYLFSNGTNIGTVASSSTTPSYGFGLSSEISAAPEPSQVISLGLVALGLGGLLLRARRRLAAEFADDMRPIL